MPGLATAPPTGRLEWTQAGEADPAAASLVARMQADRP